MAKFLRGDGTGRRWKVPSFPGGEGDPFFALPRISRKTIPTARPRVFSREGDWFPLLFPEPLEEFFFS